MKKQQDQQPSNSKIEEISKNFVNVEGQTFTSEHGVPVNDSHNSLKAGERGPTLLEDFLMREKLAHFDRERIPERVVHARGSAAHGVFKLTKDLSAYTTAHFLTHVGEETPLFLRFSTVAGFRGSTDLARDVRGFSVKFYTKQGNYDIVGNNIPVFFIQDAMKFPDLVHSVKPEPNHEMPQAGSAHDTFWDFISLTPESTHMVMWAMSDRGIPRSYRMMEGFGVHTYKLVNAKGEAHFVKFHWKPKLGVHSVAWDEAQKISGKNSDFHREDLWEAIENGAYPQWDLGLQIIPEKDEMKFDFDVLDPTKLIPEELVPVEIVGTMTLNRNPQNFFAETEQVAFSPANIVPGIDFSNDPLLQGRIFSYTDTQLHRLGGANFTQLPINRPLEQSHNTLRDGQFQHRIHEGTGHYTPNTTAKGCPFLAKQMEGGFVSHGERVEGYKIRARSKSFLDHYSQAKLFYNSQTEYEKNHIKDAISFELSKVKDEKIRERVLQQFSNVDMELVKYVADKLGLKAPASPTPIENKNIPADGNPADYASVIKEPSIAESNALSMAKIKKPSLETRKIATFVADGFDADEFNTFKNAVEAKGGVCCPIAPKGVIKDNKGIEIPVTFTFFNCASVLFDAVFVMGGKDSAKELSKEASAIAFADEAFKHCKAIGGSAETETFFEKTNLYKNIKDAKDEGFSIGDVEKFLQVASNHRVWDLEKQRQIPA